MIRLFQRGKDLLDRVQPEVNLIELVVLRLRTTGDNYSPVTGITAYRRVLSLSDARVRDGTVPVGTIEFHMQVSTMQGNLARQHDWLVDSLGVVYGIEPSRQGVFTDANGGSWQTVTITRNV